jgi:hypothetical protein
VYHVPRTRRKALTAPSGCFFDAIKRERAKNRFVGDAEYHRISRRLFPGKPTGPLDHQQMMISCVGEVVPVGLIIASLRDG